MLTSQPRAFRRAPSGVLALCLLVAACASPLVIAYPGPRRGASEVSHITARGRTKLLVLNGQEVDGRTFEVLSGEQSLRFRVTVRGEEVHEGAMGQQAHMLCDATFGALPSHVYWIIRGASQYMGQSETFTSRTRSHFFDVAIFDMSAEAPQRVGSTSCRWI